jgi:hypothetical protein
MVKLFSEAVTLQCLGALNRLRNQPLLQRYYLAGGTALALQLGHRLAGQCARRQDPSLLKIPDAPYS